MNTAELIYREAKDLPENLCAEVLDFIGYLKARYPMAMESMDEMARIEELERRFAPYRRDLSGFKFDREEANER